MRRLEVISPIDSDFEFDRLVRRRLSDVLVYSGCNRGFNLGLFRTIHFYFLWFGRREGAGAFAEQVRTHVKSTDLSSDATFYRQKYGDMMGKQSLNPMLPLFTAAEL